MDNWVLTRASFWGWSPGPHAVGLGEEKVVLKEHFKLHRLLMYVNEWKLPPSPSQSLWVQPGIPSGKEAHLLTAPTLVRMPLWVPAAPSDQVEK